MVEPTSSFIRAGAGEAVALLGVANAGGLAITELMLGAAAQPKTHLGVTTSQSIDKATENARHTQTLVLQPSIRSSSLCNIADVCR